MLYLISHPKVTTLWALLSSSFLQTLPELVTPLKGHSLYLHSCPRTLLAPSEKFGYIINKTLEATEHSRTSVNMCSIPTRVRKKRRVLSRFKNLFCFICAGVNDVGGHKGNAWCNLSCLLRTYCHLSSTENQFVSWQSSKTYGVASYDSGWRKDDVNQRLEFEGRRAPLVQVWTELSTLLGELTAYRGWLDRCISRQGLVRWLWTLRFDVKGCLRSFIDRPTAMYLPPSPPPTPLPSIQVRFMGCFGCGCFPLKETSYLHPKPLRLRAAPPSTSS